MKKILYTADIHVSHQHLHWFLHAAQQLAADCLIIGGDLIPVRERKIADSIEPQRRWVAETFLPAMKAFKEANSETKIFLDFGNDDLLAARPLLEAEDGKIFHLIHNRIVEMAPDLIIIGYMDIPPTPFMLKDWERRDCEERSGFDEHHDIRWEGLETSTGRAKNCDLASKRLFIFQELASLFGDLCAGQLTEELRVIFVSHCPPLNTPLDLMHDGTHGGSKAVKDFIDLWQGSKHLLATLHGHIHEAPEMSGTVMTFSDNIPCFNMGQKEEQLQGLLIDLTFPKIVYRSIKVDSHDLHTSVLRVTPPPKEERRYFSSKNPYADKPFPFIVAKELHDYTGAEMELKSTYLLWSKEMAEVISATPRLTRDATFTYEDFDGTTKEAILSKYEEYWPHLDYFYESSELEPPFYFLNQLVYELIRPFLTGEAREILGRNIYSELWKGFVFCVTYFLNNEEELFWVDDLLAKIGVQLMDRNCLKVECVGKVRECFDTNTPEDWRLWLAIFRRPNKEEFKEIVAEIAKGYIDMSRVFRPEYLPGAATAEEEEEEAACKTPYLDASGRLRSEPAIVDEYEIREAFRLGRDSKPLEYTSNDFVDNGDGTISDRATGLMWQQSGSDWLSCDADTGPEYVAELNRQRFAGHDDWRLPTVPELLSLLEPEKSEAGIHLSPLFADDQHICLSADKPWEGTWWCVFYGLVVKVDRPTMFNEAMVRAVRNNHAG